MVLFVARVCALYSHIHSQGLARRRL